jgi:hypothetical protein
MKLYLASGLALSLAASSFSTPAMAQQAETLELRHQLAQEIIDRGFPEETRMDLFGGVMQQLVAQLNVAQPELAENPVVQEIVLAYQQRAIALGMATLENHMDALMEALAASYAEIYSLDELHGFHAFVTTPQGYGFLAKSSAAAGHPAFAAANQAYMNEYMAQIPQLQQELREELLTALAEAANEETAS